MIKHFVIYCNEIYSEADEPDELEELNNISRKSSTVTKTGKMSNGMVGATETVANGKNNEKFSASTASLYSNSLKSSNCTGSSTGKYTHSYTYIFLLIVEKIVLSELELT